MRRSKNLKMWEEINFQEALFNFLSVLFYCVDTTPCDPAPCKNGATCVGNSTTGEYTCECVLPFYGDDCETGMY